MPKDKNAVAISQCSAELCHARHVLSKNELAWHGLFTWNAAVADPQEYEGLWRSLFAVCCTCRDCPEDSPNMAKRRTKNPVMMPISCTHCRLPGRLIVHQPSGKFRLHAIDHECICRETITWPMHGYTPMSSHPYWMRSSTMQGISPAKKLPFTFLPSGPVRRRETISREFWMTWWNVNLHSRTFFTLLSRHSVGSEAQERQILLWCTAWCSLVYI